MISETALEIDYMDVVTASLNSEAGDDVYMELPEGVPKANTIVKLEKDLHGLEIAPRLWNRTTNAFLSLEFTQSEADPNLLSDARRQC